MHLTWKGGGEAYKWGLGARKQQFTEFISLPYLYTNRLLMKKLGLLVVSYSVTGVLYSFLLQKPTEVK